MVPHRNSLYEQSKANLGSLVKQTSQVGLGFLVMLLLTGGSPSGLIVALSVCLGIGFVVWDQIKEADNKENRLSNRESSVVNIPPLSNHSENTKDKAKNYLDSSSVTINISSNILSVGSASYRIDKIDAVEAIKIKASLLELATVGRSYAVLIRSTGDYIFLARSRDKKSIIEVAKMIRYAMTEQKQETIIILILLILTDTLLMKISILK